LSGQWAPYELGRRPVALAGAAGAVLLVTGCTSRHRRGQPVLPPQRENPDEALVARALAAEQALVRRIELTTRRHPSLRRHVREALIVHRSHVELLQKAGDGQRSGAASATPHHGEVRVPAAPRTAVAALVRAEQSLERSQATAALKADSGVFARVLAGMAAAAAQQAVLLGDARARVRGS
jgi:hypothetical protein